MTLKGVVNLLHLEGAEVPATDPVVTLALSIADDKIRVYFDQAMRATNPGNSDDALNPANYIITSSLGVARNAVSVVLTSGSPTIVEITLNGEMTNGAAYSVTVSGVRSVFGVALDPVRKSANFTGQGTAPEVSSASASSASQIIVNFNEDMRNNSALLTPSNYVIGGYASIVILSITRNSSTQVTLLVENTMKTGATYSVTVSNVQDVSYNVIASPGNVASFIGVGDNPKLLSAAIPVNSEHVRIQFSKDVIGSEGADPANYDISSGALSVLSVTQETGDTFLLTTSAQTAGVLYTITVYEPSLTPPPTGINDLNENTVSPPNNVATFYGLGVSPPLIEMEPPDAEYGLAVRTPLRVLFQDVEEDFSGILKSSIWIQASYVDTNGVAQSFYCVKSGDIKPQCIGTESGDALGVEGIFYELLPRKGRWEPNTWYTVQAFAMDLEASSNMVQQSFRTTNLSCFEDIVPAPNIIDTKLTRALPYENLEKLRGVLMRSCTTSIDPNIQARTLLHVASITGLRVVLSRYVDFTLVDGILLCERQPILQIQQALMPYWGLVGAALVEVPAISHEARVLLEQYTKSSSVVYAVNAIAAAVVLAAVKQDD